MSFNRRGRRACGRDIRIVDGAGVIQQYLNTDTTSPLVATEIHYAARR
jgi:dihydrofolate reductase